MIEFMLSLPLIIVFGIIFIVLGSVFGTVTLVIWLMSIIPYTLFWTITLMFALPLAFFLGPMLIFLAAPFLVLIGGPSLILFSIFKLGVLMCTIAALVTRNYPAVLDSIYGNHKYLLITAPADPIRH